VGWLTDRLPRLVYSKEYRQSSLADGPQWLIDTWGGTSTSAGERISTENAMSIADVFAAINIIAEDVSQLPLNVYRDLNMVPGNSRTGIELATDHRAWRMLHDMPNPYTPAHRFWSTVAVHQLLWGNWYIEKLRGIDGLVAELRLIHPSKVEVQYNPDTGEKRFLVTRYGGDQETLSSERVLHGFGLTQDGLVGMSPITQAREALGNAKARIHFEGDVYGSRPYLSGTIEHPQTIKDGGVKLRESWRAIYGAGGKDRHGIGVLEEGAHFNAITAPLEDMQFVEAARMSKTEIAVLFKLPPAYLGGSTGDSLTYQTVESNKIQKATQAIAPVANNIAQFLSHDFGLFPFQSWYAEFTMEGMLRGDSKARAEYWKVMKELGVVSEDFIAEKENLPPPPPPKPVPPALVANSADGETSADKGIMAAVNGNG
jgi:HK97 family phage portal protein